MNKLEPLSDFIIKPKPEGYEMIYATIINTNYYKEVEAIESKASLMTNSSTKVKLGEGYYFKVKLTEKFEEENFTEPGTEEEKINEEDEHDNELDDLFNVYYIICLKGLWVEMKDFIRKHQKICVFGRIIDNQSTSILEVNNIVKDGKITFVITDPEVIVSPSAIKMSHPCLRRSLIASIFSNVVTNKRMMMGTIIHELFELSVLDKNLDFDKAVKAKINEHKEELIIYFNNETEASDALYEYKKNIDIIIKTYFSGNCIYNDTRNSNKKTTLVKCQDSERALQCGMIGIKGIADVLFKVKQQEGNITKEYLAPIEIKTGFRSKMDYTQTFIYSVLLNYTFDNSNVYTGFLCYLKDGKVEKQDFHVNDIVHIFKMRNQVVYYLENLEQIPTFYKSGLPDLFSEETQCKNCLNKTECYFNYMLAEEPVTKADKIYVRPDFESYFNKFDHEEFKVYYQTNMDMINYEEMESVKERKVFFSNSKQYRDYISTIDLREFYEHRVINILSGYDSTTFVLSDFQNNKTDYESRVISDLFLAYDVRNSVLLQGSIICRYTYNEEKCLLLNIPNYILPSDKGFLKSFIFNETKLFIKAFDSAYSNYSKLRSALLSIVSHKANYERLVKLKEPGFKSVNVNSFKQNLINAKIDYNNLNKDQKIALVKYAMMEDYMLLLGYPGTGKTTTLTALIKYALATDQSILICCNSNAALDNILLKLKKEKIDFIRIASNNAGYSKINKELDDNLNMNFTYLSMSKLKKKYDDCKVYASTIYSTTNKALARRKFDLCIVDEACQVLEVALLQALNKAEKFILCGDPFQLSPLVKSQKNKGVLSLFERLQNKFYSKEDAICVTLHTQYRMNLEIMSLSNICIYDNKMIGADSITSNYLSFSIQQLNHLNDQKFFLDNIWLKDAIDPKKPVIFLDYERYFNTLELINFTKDNFNDIEIDIIKLIVKSLTSISFNLNDLSILTPFKKQEARLGGKLNEIFGFNDVMTIDKSQGMEKDIIIFSMVKTDNKTKLLDDIQRINVAFTRAKKKIIIVGFFDVLKNFKGLDKFLNIIEEKKWKTLIYEVEKLKV